MKKLHKYQLAVWITLVAFSFAACGGEGEWEGAEPVSNIEQEVDNRTHIVEPTFLKLLGTGLKWLGIGGTAVWGASQLSSLPPGTMSNLFGSRGRQMGVYPPNGNMNGRYPQYPPQYNNNGWGMQQNYRNAPYPNPNVGNYGSQNPLARFWNGNPNQINPYNQYRGGGGGFPNQQYGYMPQNRFQQPGWGNPAAGGFMGQRYPTNPYQQGYRPVSGFEVRGVSAELPVVFYSCEPEGGELSRCAGDDVCVAVETDEGLTAGRCLPICKDLTPENGDQECPEVITDDGDIVQLDCIVAENTGVSVCG